MGEENEFAMAVPDDREAREHAIDTLFSEIDDNEGGTISIDEFESICHIPHIHKLLKDMGLDITPDTARGFFLMLNFDHDGSLSKDEFTMGISRVSGTAKSIDMAHVMSNYEKSLTMIEDLVAQSDKISRVEPDRNKSEANASRCTTKSAASVASKGVRKQQIASRKITNH